MKKSLLKFIRKCPFHFISMVVGILFGFVTFIDVAHGEARKDDSVETKEVHQFDSMKLRGQIRKPELSYIYKRKGIRAEKIIDIPENFYEEIKAGMDQF